VAGYPVPRVVVPVWLLGVAAFGFEVLSAFGLKNDINRARIRKLYQSTNMIPTRLEEAGFRYSYDLVAGLSAWKKSSRMTDFD
jgi:hypothetical protein